MRRLGLLLGLLVGCAQPPPEPAARQVNVLDGREPVVRVHLRSLDPWETLEVRGKGGLRVRERSGERPFVTEEAYRLARTARPVALEPLEGIVTVGGHTFAGEIRWDGRWLVNHVTLENYVLGVLRGELPLKHVPPDAAAAQAIAVRSFTFSYLVADRPAFDLDDTTAFQRYVGLRYAPDDAHLREGVRRTTGLYLEDEHAPLRAYYHSTCGGHTTDVPSGLDRAPVAVMGGVSCPYCEGTRYWRWSAALEAGPILKAAALSGPLEAFEVVETGPGGRATKIRVAGGGREKVLHANQFRRAYGASALRSTLLLDVARQGDEVRVQGGGWGHGVGLCQLGAIGMAEAGGSGTEIVAYYYPGATLRRAY